MAIVGSALHVTRAGTVAGTHFPLDGSPVWMHEIAVDHDAHFVDRLETDRARGVGAVAPGLLARLRGDAFEALAGRKVADLHAYADRLGTPFRDEDMAVPLAVVQRQGELHIVCRAIDEGVASPFRYSHVLATRQVLDTELTETTRAAVLAALAAVRVDDAVLPVLPRAALGVNVVRVASSDYGDVAVLTMQGAASITGSSAEVSAGAGMVGSTGGAISLPREQRRARTGGFDLLHAAEREMREETAIGFLAGRRIPIGLMTQRDLQLATVVIDDWTQVSADAMHDRLHGELDLISSGGESAHVEVAGASGGSGDTRRSGAAIVELELTALDEALHRYGPSFEFFQAARSVAPDANESQRFLGLPLTEPAFERLLFDPVLRFAPWTVVLLVATAEHFFGRTFAESLATRMTTPDLMAAAFAAVDHGDAGAKVLVEQLESERR